MLTSLAHPRTVQLDYILASFQVDQTFFFFIHIRSVRERCTRSRLLMEPGGKKMIQMGKCLDCTSRLYCLVITRGVEAALHAEREREREKWARFI